MIGGALFRFRHRLFGAATPDLVVDALRPKVAERVHRPLGFEPTTANPVRLYLPMETLRDAVRAL